MKDRQALQARIAENSRRINEEVACAEGSTTPPGVVVQPHLAGLRLPARRAGGGGHRAGAQRALHRVHRGVPPGGSATFVEERGGNRVMMRAGHGDDDDDDDEGGGGLFGGQGEPLDLREMPRYEPPTIHAREAVAPAIADLGLLAFLIVAAFAVAFGSFLRYDVRPG